MSYLKVSGIRRFLGAMLVPLFVASQAIGGNSPDQAQTQAKSKGTVMNARNGDPKKINGYAPVNGLKMYYEIEGTGDPLVFIPPALGFAGRESFPELVQNHSVITVDLQGNGRTADIPERPISIEQYAKDVVDLLKYLKIAKADFLGESCGRSAVRASRCTRIFRFKLRFQRHTGKTTTQPSRECTPKLTSGFSK
jgi:hypothetical protein